MAKPLITVLIAAYNHERYVAETIRSVIEQDWPRMELIVIDDGSPDGTWGVLQGLKNVCERRFERVVFLQQENAGTGVTLNRLWEQARGEYVAMVASDDAFMPGAFSRLAAALEVHPEAGLAVGVNEWMDSQGNRCYWNAEGRAVSDDNPERFETFNDYLSAKTGVAWASPEYGTYAAFLRGNHVVNGAVVRRSMFAKILPYRKEAPLEDYWSHLQLSKRARYVCVQHHTFRYRWHESNTMRNTSHIDDMWRRTLGWEEANLVSQKDWTHLRQYLSARAEKLSERRLFGGVLSVAWYSTPFSALRLLNVFGRTIRARRVLRNGRA